MKKGLLFTVIIFLAVYLGFGIAGSSEAKDKMSKHDRQIVEEFKNSFNDSGDGRFQTTRMDDTSIFIIDTKLGHCWVFRTSPGPMVKYAGKVRPGTTFWDAISRQK